MEQVPAGISLPFDYTAYDEATDLDIAMNVYDTTTGTPSFVSQNAMEHVLLGSYVGFFTPTDQHSYLIEKCVYTDNTFATPDPNYSPGSETIFAGSQSVSVPTTQSFDAVAIVSVNDDVMAITQVSNHTLVLIQLDDERIA